jgi:hypothetical protein
MLNLFSFFKQQANEFRQSNKSRSTDYIAGGIDALREAGDTLTRHKDVVDLEWVTNQLNEAYKEARELRVLNKAFDESRRTFQSKSDLQAKELEQLRSRLANQKRDTITAEIQSRVDKTAGHWQSLCASLHNVFYEAAIVLSGNEQQDNNKVVAATKVLAHALTRSTSRKHKVLAAFLKANEATTVAIPNTDKGEPSA